MTQQTAVEFLISFLFEKSPQMKESDIQEFILSFAKSLEIEKNQILNAYKDGFNAGDFGSDCCEKTYYDELYKK